MGDGAKGEEKLGAREQVRVASKPGQVAQALTCVILEYPSICPSQHVPAFPAPGRPRLLPSLHASMCSSSPLWEKTQNGQHAVSLCPWCSRVQLSPGLSCSPPRHGTHLRRGRSWQSQWKGTSRRLRISSPVKLLMSGMLLILLLSR